jgi:hypothetical protein
MTAIRAALSGLSLRQMVAGVTMALVFLTLAVLS